MQQNPLRVEQISIHGLSSAKGFPNTKHLTHASFHVEKLWSFARPAADDCEISRSDVCQGQRESDEKQGPSKAWT